MSLNSVLLGAGIFQIKDHIGKKTADVASMGGIDDFRDDGIDQYALKASYELATKCGANCGIKDFTNAFKKVAIKLREEE